MKLYSCVIEYIKFPQRLGIPVVVDNESIDAWKVCVAAVCVTLEVMAVGSHEPNEIMVSGHVS